MARLNKKTTKSGIFATEKVIVLDPYAFAVKTVERPVRLAGGGGAKAAKQPSEANLRRLVMTCLLWEDNFYVDGQTIVEQIKELIPQVDPNIVADMAIEARYTQKLRHVPLMLVRELARQGYPVAPVLAKVCKRPDEITEFLSIYWADNKGKKSLPAQVKLGLATAFNNYGEYSMAKWQGKTKEVKLRDALRLVHPKPKDLAQSILFKKLKEGELATPDTWEVGLSAAKSESDKKAVWEHLINEEKLPALAFMKNIRNMEQVNVSRKLIQNAFANCHPDMLLPIDFLRAYDNSKEWGREIEDLMFRCAAQWPRLDGHTVFVVDTSGSMMEKLNNNTDYTRMDIAASLSVLAAECCDHISVYATAGNDSRVIHATQKIQNVRGFALRDKILEARNKLGGGGIFTRQVCEYLREHEPEQPDRVIIFSDSQDCDRYNSVPKPYGKKNYIIDVSSHKHGINYRGLWTAELSAWSDGFLRYIAEYERTLN
jgi:hypothetical protein